jgi:hypothetical protein
MSFYIPRRVGSRFAALCNSYAQHDGLPFASALTEEQIQRAAVEEGVWFGADAECVFSLATTLWAFITQFTSDSRTCVAAVARVTVLLVAMGREPCSANTGAYCKARAELPEGFLRRSTYEVGNCSYFMIAALLRRGGNAAFRMHQLRHYDFNKGRRLGPDDHIVNWVRPQRPDWMDAATYATMPEDGIDQLQDAGHVA